MSFPKLHSLLQRFLLDSRFSIPFLMVFLRNIFRVFYHLTPHWERFFIHDFLQCLQYTLSDTYTVFTRCIYLSRKKVTYVTYKITNGS